MTHASSAAYCCATCGVQLNQSGREDTNDCGGDCLHCQACFGDPHAMEAMRALEPDNPQWKDDE